MFDQVSDITSQRLRKGTRKDEVVNLFLTVYAFFFFTPSPGTKKGWGYKWKKAHVWPKPVHFWCLILFLSPFFG